MTIKIGVPKEVREGEQRVALVPDSVNRLTKQDILVTLETGAGALAGYTDDYYENAEIAASSAEILSKSDICLTVNPATNEQIEQLKEGSILIGYLNPHSDLERFNKLKAKKNQRILDGINSSNIQSAGHGCPFITGLHCRL
jgi:NAD(P) transhydrogenase subunit alpha